MTLILTGGGTGGHVYPLLAVAAALNAGGSGGGQREDVLFVGGKGGMEERLAANAGIPFSTVVAEAIRGRGTLGAARGATVLGRGAIEARRLLRARGATSVLATGGFASVPVSLAARSLGIPLLLYLPDVVPGMAVKMLSRFASVVAVTTEESRRYLPAAKVVVTGYPVRREVLEADRTVSRSNLGLATEPPVLLCLGGSRGALTLNQAVERDLPALLTGWQVLHISGQNAGASDVFSTRPSYHRYEYLDSAAMADALAAADLVVSRAGASTLGEYTVRGLASVLVPYPYAGAHQWHNARVLERAGAGIIVENAAVALAGLIPSLEPFRQNPERLAEMRSAALKLACPDAANRIAAIWAGLGASGGAR